MKTLFQKTKSGKEFVQISSDKKVAVSIYITELSSRVLYTRNSISIQAYFDEYSMEESNAEEFTQALHIHHQNQLNATSALVWNNL